MQERKARVNNVPFDLPCELCEVREPDIHPNNMEIWRILRLCSNQWRVSGMGGAYGMDYSAVIEVAKAMDMEINPIFFEKISAYENTALAGMKKKIDSAQTASERTAGNA